MGKAVVAFLAACHCAAGTKLAQMSTYKDDLCSTDLHVAEIAPGICVRMDTSTAEWTKMTCTDTGIKRVTYSDNTCTTETSSLVFGSSCTGSNGSFIKGMCIDATVPAPVKATDVYVMTQHTEKTCGSGANHVASGKVLAGGCAADDDGGSIAMKCVGGLPYAEKYMGSKCEGDMHLRYRMNVCTGQDNSYRMFSCSTRSSAAATIATYGTSANCAGDVVSTIVVENGCKKDGQYVSGAWVPRSTKYTVAAGSTTYQEADYPSYDCSGTPVGNTTSVTCGECAEKMGNWGKVTCPAAASVSGGLRSAAGVGAGLVMSMVYCLLM